MSNFESDKLNVPNWMNDVFFENVLKKCESTDTILIQNVEITPASSKADNYTSVMFRVKVTFDSRHLKNQSKSLVIKTMSEQEGSKRDFLSESLVFETEIGMYSKTLQQFEEDLRKIGDDTVFGPRGLYWSLKPQKLIVLEDISVRGYDVIRHRMANMEEIKTALLKLSKWHAVSYKRINEGNNDMSSYCENLFSKKGAESIPFMTRGITNFIEKLETIDDLKTYVPHLKRIESELLQKCIASSKSFRDKSAKGIFVLAHGDFHIKNIMTKRNQNQELEDILLVDFQLCSISPAILDVMFGIYTFCDPELRRNNFDEIFHFYCSNFIDTLEKLKFQGEIPKISDFYIEMYRHRHFELFIFASFLPMWYGLAEGRLGSLDEFLESEEHRKRMYDIPNYLEDVKQVLPKMFYRGYLE